MSSTDGGRSAGEEGPPPPPNESASTRTNNSNNNNNNNSSSTTGTINNDANNNVTQQIYTESGNCKRFLFLASVGIRDGDGNPLMDLNVAPWSAIPRKELKPQRTEYHSEVVRRARVLGVTPLPRPAGWSTTKAIAWLESNPIVAANDRAFVVSETGRLGMIARKSLAERSQQIEERMGKWRGAIPHLRLILCVIEDDIRPLFLLRRADVVVTRWEMDAASARNPSRRSDHDNDDDDNDHHNNDYDNDDVFEAIAERWNDPAFNPRTPVSGCHLEYCIERDCSHRLVAGLAPATSRRVRDLLTSMRSDLLRIIQNWERIGQAEGGFYLGDVSSRNDGGRDDDDNDDDDNPPPPTTTNIIDLRSESFGTLSNRSTRALQSRESFLGGRPPHLLLFWELCDKHRLLQPALQRLDPTVAAAVDENSTTPSISGSEKSCGRKRDLRDCDDDDDHGGDGDRIASAISDMIRSQRDERKSQARLEDQNRRIRREELRSMERVERLRQASEDRRHIRRRIECLEDQAQSMRTRHAEAVEAGRKTANFYLAEADQLAQQIGKLTEEYNSMS